MRILWGGGHGVQVSYVGGETVSEAVEHRIEAREAHGARADVDGDGRLGELGAEGEQRLDAGAGAQVEQAVARGAAQVRREAHEVERIVPDRHHRPLRWHERFAVPIRRQEDVRRR